MKYKIPKYTAVHLFKSRPPYRVPLVDQLDMETEKDLFYSDKDCIVPAGLSGRSTEIYRYFKLPENSKGYTLLGVLTNKVVRY